MEINQTRETASALARLDPELQKIVLYVAQGILLARMTEERSEDEK